MFSQPAHKNLQTNKLSRNSVLGCNIIEKKKVVLHSCTSFKSNVQSNGFYVRKFHNNCRIMHSFRGYGKISDSIMARKTLNTLMKKGSNF